MLSLLVRDSVLFLLVRNSFCSLVLLLSCFYFSSVLLHIVSYHALHCIICIFTSLALELFWDDELVLACARLYSCLSDHGWLSSLESVEY